MEYMITKMSHIDKDGCKHIEYRGSVIGSHGYWITKDFPTRAEAEAWCKSNQEHKYTLPKP